MVTRVTKYANQLEYQIIYEIKLQRYQAPSLCLSQNKSQEMKIELCMITIKV